MDLPDRGLAQTPLGYVDDALEGKVVGRLGDDAEECHRITNFQPLVKTRTADNAVIEPERDETVFKFAHLEGGADEDRHVIKGMAVALMLFDLFAYRTCLFFRVPGRMDVDLGVLRIDGIGEQCLAQPPFVVSDQMRGCSKYMCCGSVVALEADDLGAGKILLEPQDVVDLGSAPAIDRLVVIADTADVDFGGRARRSHLANLPP